MDDITSRQSAVSVRYLEVWRDHAHQAYAIEQLCFDLTDILIDLAARTAAPGTFVINGDHEQRIII